MCPYCVAAKNFFEARGHSYEEVMVDSKPEIYAELKAKTNWMTVPQIFINDQFIGGYTDLQKLEREGKLTAILES